MKKKTISLFAITLIALASFDSSIANERTYPFETDKTDKTEREEKNLKRLETQFNNYLLALRTFQPQKARTFSRFLVIDIRSEVNRTQLKLKAAKVELDKFDEYEKETVEYKAQEEEVARLKQLYRDQKFISDEVTLTDIGIANNRDQNIILRNVKFFKAFIETVDADLDKEFITVNRSYLLTNAI